MITGKTRSWALLTALMMLVPVWAMAQHPCESRAFCGTEFEPADPRSLDSILGEFEKELAGGDFLAVYRELRHRAAFEPGLQADLKDPLVGSFEAFLDKVADPLHACPNWFTPQPFPDETGINACTLFAGTDDAIAIDPLCGDRDAEARTLGYYAHAVALLCHEQNKPAREQILGIIAATDEEWERFLFEGFPMFPWEAFLNSRLFAPKDIQDIPNRQWILLHPSLGAEVLLDDFDDMTGNEVISAEVGHLWYRNDHRNWWGLGVVATFRDDTGGGLGPVFHWNNFSFGVVWHDLDDNGDRFDDNPNAYLGIELYQWSKKKLTSWKEKIAKVRETSLKEGFGKR